MKYAQMRKMDISNGEGVRASLFVQGCDFHCDDCFNSDTWDWGEGKEFTIEKEAKLLSLCLPNYIKGLSILGGEPLHPNNIDTVIHIAKSFKEQFPNKDLWIWTGYKFENIINKDILNYTDYIIDGQFEKDKKDMNLKFRGSSNQRIWKKKSNNEWCNITEATDRLSNKGDSNGRE